MPRRIEAALHYNEHKVQQGTAMCIAAVNYLREANEMNVSQKLAGFLQRTSLNERATTKTLHVSLNFDPSEQLSEQQLLSIAAAYMEQIGFAAQPYLVYRHFDAAHPHMHIVSTTIKSDGSRINTHNIGRNQSEKARKEIEASFGLIKAERQQRLRTPAIKPVDVATVVYGKSETHRSISNVVSAVFSQYVFCSLPEFNAALQQFNVVADRGSEKGRIYSKRGLLYRVLDEKGTKTGVPIKASAIGCQPTLDRLEKKFATHTTARQSLQPFVKAKLDECLVKSPASVQELIVLLQQKKIYTVLRQNAEGRLYGITFVDNQNKAVLNGSAIGKGYSIAALQKTFATAATVNTKKAAADVSRKMNPVPAKEFSLTNVRTVTKQQTGSKENLFVRLLTPEQTFTNTPYHLLKKKRKKKRKNTDT
ncbi:relaxase/mobilization nuclease-like protein [Lacibacter cauensis]|uniref:Relaxase/mobilization nuclease-like protein n=1 Tax=Lacibacter cauensis TaxID=510947 RepID=A0A562SYN9_9BACT|nr:relaxase/mobilization nuclease domain-containing protein [Lacibacter cauensis]TWI85760.1 relaxase/mobilization nuclease-like protein [Lacibacter cauensis]